MSRCLHSLLIIALIGLGSTSAIAEPVIGASARHWLAELDGDVLLDDDALAAGPTRVDFENDLDLDVDNEIQEIALSIDTPFLDLHVSYFQVSYDGNSTLTRDITFGDLTFTATTPVESELDLRWASAMLEIDLLPDTKIIDADLGVVIGLKFVDLYMRIEDAAQSEEKDFTGGAPAVGLQGGLNFSDWGYVSGWVTGIRGTISNFEASLIDGGIEAGFVWYLLAAGVGYRQLALDVKAEDSDTEVELDASISGIYIHVGIRF